MALIDHLKAQPPGSPVPPDEVDQIYRKWRIRTMYSMMFGYALFYFVRKNFSMAMPAIKDELGYSRTDLGLVLTTFSIIYGLGKFLNGTLADRANPRYFMAIGLLGAAAVNIFFGLSSSLFFFGVFWLINAWFQSMGWPPCARLLTHWYGKQEIGSWWGIWNASHQIGGAGILILSGWLIQNFGWRSAFFVPSAIAILGALLLMTLLRDSPSSLGLPPIEKYRPAASPEEPDQEMGLWRLLKEEVFTNPIVWLMSFANFFVYIVRIGMLDWAPSFLIEAKGSDLSQAGWQVAAFEIAGIFGGLAAGWISDRIFRGGRAPVNIIYMLLLISALILLWLLPSGSLIRDALLLVAIGFLVYGPQMLTTVATTDNTSRKAAATATGFVGLFGYLGSAVCGVGTGMIVDHWGWNGGFIFFLSAGLGALLIFLSALYLGRVKLNS